MNYAPNPVFIPPPPIMLDQMIVMVSIMFLFFFFSFSHAIKKNFSKAGREDGFFLRIDLVREIESS